MGSINDALKRYMENSVADPIGFGTESPNYRRIASLGNIGVSSAGTDVWPLGTVYPFKTTATTVEVFCSSASDTNGGTGAWTIVVNGLDTNYNEISETVILNGGVQALVGTYIAINNAFVSSSGITNSAVGDISIRDSGGGTVRQVIKAVYGVSRSSVYTVPAGYTLSEISVFGCINRVAAGGQANYITMSTGQRNPTGNVRLPLEFTFSSVGPYRHDAVPGIITTERNSFFLRITAQSAAVDVTGAWLGVLKRNVPI
jgi:hypothetical protein